MGMEEKEKNIRKEKENLLLLQQELSQKMGA
jgi:hypothetical protein